MSSPVPSRDLEAARPPVAPVSRWHEFLPADTAVGPRERWRAALGAAFGVLVAALLCRVAGPAALPWLVAPIGATALLVFAVPASPFAQPWAAVAGNTVSALVGIGCVIAFGDAPWVPALAVGLAIVVMFQLRCLHPPGGACAVLVALGHVHDPSYAFYPVLANTLLLVAAGMLYNRATGRPYPHRQRAGAAPPQENPARRSFNDADLDAVLARYDRVLDVSPNELHEIVDQARVEAYRRRSARTRCVDLMSRDPIAVHYGTPLQEAWSLLRDHRVKALPVIDSVRRVIGVVTLADFMRQAALDDHAAWPRKLQALIRATPTTHSDKPEAVGQIMTRRVRVVSADRPIADLLPMFADTGHHHVPVIDAERRLVGILTQSDLVRALCRGE